MKRLFDLAVSLTALTLLSPLWLAITLAIYLESGRPIYFKQVRCGKGLKRFNLLKFRTMTNGNHKVVNLEHDHRVTKVGRILRTTSLDSLPELLSIVKGDMSFVGPRPMPYEVEDEPGYPNIEKIPGHYKRSHVKPGLTGIAQVYCSKFVSRKYKFRYDNIYVSKACFLLDIKLIIISILYTIGRDWERQNK
jgi:lipopolysaccharide/colanic/teichoic acid biosynthesis glycosyltransferase